MKATATTALAKYNFTVRFVRPMKTNDTTADYSLTNVATDIFWGVGNVVNFEPSPLIAGNYGSASLDLTMAPTTTTKSGAITMMLGYLALMIATFIFF